MCFTAAKKILLKVFQVHGCYIFQALLIYLYCQTIIGHMIFAMRSNYKTSQTAIF